MENSEENIFLREIEDHEFREIAEFSFDNFVSELAKSSGESFEETKRKAGGPPLTRRESDLWRAIDLNGKRVGFIWVNVNLKEKTSFGYDIYLDGKHRGKGYGRRVMDEGRELLRSLGVEKISICVFEENTVARALYSSIGFETEKFNEKNRQYTLSLNI